VGIVGARLSSRRVPCEEVLVLGAGPAGLTAALHLAQRGRRVRVLEREDLVGGLARTEERDGFRFDLGGHRFFTKHPEVQALWEEILGDELIVRPRLSRIRYDGRMFAYPLDALDVVRNLGALELSRALGSYLRARASTGETDTFEEWVTRRFGRRLYEMFFSTYTEKVWGVPGSELRAEWAAQRIRGLSFGKAARAAFKGVPDDASGSLRSLVGEFHYPRLGPGQMWEAMRDRVEALGGEVLTGTPATSLHVEEGRVVGVSTPDTTYECSDVISSLPLATIVGTASPGVPASVAVAASGLRYRDFLTVALILDGPDPFPDTWIYVHEPGVRVARIQNFRAWSPAMVPDPTASCIGLEYFCFEGDDLWRTDDSTLVELAARELDTLGLGGGVRAGHVVRVPHAYPIYDATYAARVSVLRAWVDSVRGLQQIGRNGLHRYNNLDHSMLTAARAVENLCDEARHDVWSVNADSWYHEELSVAESPYLEAPDRPALQGTIA
jgi:protoporphyrinogen oxidase